MDPTAPPFRPPGFYDAASAIAVDLDCKKCGYNLRGLREDGRCPECGTPVGLSTRGDLLRFSDPDWVESVAKGLAIILWMILIGILMGIVGGILGRLTAPVVTHAITFLTQLMSFYGVWLMTTPDPGGIGEDKDITARKVVRFALVVGLVAGPLEFVIEEISMSEPARLLLGLLILAAGLVSLAGEFAKFVYYEKLAHRVPNRELADRARFLRWAYVITLGIVLVIGGLVMIFASGGMTRGGVLAPLALLLIPAAIALLVFGIMTIILLVRLRRAIRAQAEAARRTWALALQAASPVEPRQGMS